MKSPFPGMDPYLEPYWSNFHVLMMGALTAALNQSLPRGLQARPEQEVRIETLAGENLAAYRPDVAVFGNEPAISGPVHFHGTLVAEPIHIPYQHAPIFLRDVRIVDTRDRDRVVTAIEVLSPWNKRPGKLNLKYIRKLHDFEDAGTNWVEIDLLRSSRRRMITDWQDVPSEKRGDYLVTSYRTDEERISAYPFKLRDRLPVVLIPLRDVDDDVQLNLQEVFDRVYSEGRFSSVNYSKPLVPSLSPADAEWAAGLVASRKGAL